MNEIENTQKRIHIINHHGWPDGSPICIITEQVCVYLTRQQVPVVMVSSSGQYRSVNRGKPDIEQIVMPTTLFKRNNVFQSIAEYIVVFRAFRNYVHQHVKAGDVLVVTSAPPANVLLRYALGRKKVKTVFWLFDYFPGYMFPLGLPKFLYKFLRKAWDSQLRHYDHVIKIAGNLGYYGTNAVVHRLWPTISIQPQAGISTKKALYSGNLGMAHDVEALVKSCEELRDQGYELTIHADGPGVDRLPDWLKKRTMGLLAREDDYKQALIEHDIHLVTSTPGSDELSFPSKIWNSLAAGKKVIPCGFYGKMQTEFNDVLSADYKAHLTEVGQFIKAQLD